MAVFTRPSAAVAVVVRLAAAVRTSALISSACPPSNSISRRMNAVTIANRSTSAVRLNVGTYPVTAPITSMAVFTTARAGSAFSARPLAAICKSNSRAWLIFAMARTSSPMNSTTSPSRRFNVTKSAFGT